MQEENRIDKARRFAFGEKKKTPKKQKLTLADNVPSQRKGEFSKC